MNQKYRRISLASIIASVVLLTSGCAGTLVQPYDEKLLSDTESLFKKTSSMIDDGISKSPKTDAERQQLKSLAAAKNSPAPISDQSAHISKFESRYSELSVDADALILRSLSKAQDVDATGNKLQKGVEELIEKNIPSACKVLQDQFSAITSSLTVMNYVDLKCIILRWKEQHEDAKLTDGTGILKKSNWELRRSTIFAATLAIGRAETAKKK